MRPVPKERGGVVTIRDVAREARVSIATVSRGEAKLYCRHAAINKNSIDQMVKQAYHLHARFGALQIGLEVVGWQELLRRDFDREAQVRQRFLPIVPITRDGLAKESEARIGGLSPLVENGVLQEVHVERSSRRGLISNIYKGRVSRVLPGMQAAFVEVGLARTAFLHASDIARNPDEDAPDRESEPNIRDCVQVGDELLVQVLKDPIGTKGARLTTYISIPSRFVVMLPHSTSPPHPPVTQDLPTKRKPAGRTAFFNNW